MTTLTDVTSKKKPDPSAEESAARELVRIAREQGLSLTGPDGLLKQFTRSVLETALNEEMTEHLGHEKHRAPEERDSTNIRNGTRPKTVLTEATGQVEIEVPRDRDGSFEPQIVKKRQRRLTGVDEIVLSLYAKGLTTGEISAHFAEIYGASVSRETISRITDKVIEEMNDWANRPLDGVYAAVFLDAIVVKVRDGGLVSRGERRPRVVGRQRRGGGEVLAGGAHRPEEPGYHRCVLPGLRRAEGPTRRRVERLALDHRARLHHPLDPQHLPARVPAGLGSAEAGREADLHRPERSRRPGCAGRSHRQLGRPLPGDDPVVGKRLGRVHPLPRLRRRDPGRDLLHERDRELERPLPAGGQSPRPLPHRAGRDEMSLPGHPIPGPDRERPDTMDHEMEAGAQRVRHHLRRPLAGSRNLLMKTAGNTVAVTDPSSGVIPRG